MPLKLLAKKSWHVYNADNVARVRRDEAEARAREADEERQQRAAESSQRAALLRGEAADGTEATEISGEQSKWAAAAERATNLESTEGPAPVVTSRPSTRRPRKRHGEDDTDFEMRMARAQVDEEDSAASPNRRQKTSAIAAAETERPLYDRNGNIDLFGQLEESAVARQRTRPVNSIPDAPPSSMRFADAAGGANALSAWYAGEKGPTPASKPTFSSSVAPSSFNSNKPRRPPIAAPAGSMAADPLAAMRQGAAAVRALKQERQRETEERNRTMASLVAEQERERERERERDRERRHRHRRHEHRHHDRHRDERRRRDEDSDKDDIDSLEGFTLDGDSKEKRRRDDIDSKERRHHSYRDRRDDRDDRHSERRHHDLEKRHHRDDKDRERSLRHHHRDRDDRSRSLRVRPRSRDGSSLSPRSRISA